MSKSKHFLQCPMCGELHHFKIDHNVLAFACDFLEGVVHWDFYSKEEIERHKKEAEPKGGNNIFRKKGGEP